MRRKKNNVIFADYNPQYGFKEPPLFDLKLLRADLYLLPEAG